MTKTHKCTDGEWSFHTYGDPTPRPVNDGKWFFAEYCIGHGRKLLADVRFQTSTGGGYPTVDSIEEFTANANMMRCARRLYEALEAMVDEGDGGMAATEGKAALADARGEKPQ